MATLSHEPDYLGSAVSRLGSEAAFTVFGRARQLQALGRDIIHFEIGEPDFDTPAHIKAAGKAAIDANFTHYAPNPGLMEFRELIAIDAVGEFPNRRRQGQHRDLDHVESLRVIVDPA